MDVMSYDIQIDVCYKPTQDMDKRTHWFLMMKWCNENLGEHAADFIDYWNEGYVLFDNEEDAMAFKLGWL